MDSAEPLGLGQVSLRMVGWATGLADFDNDGQLDLWVVNGHTLERKADNSRLQPQTMQLFQQRPGEGFFETSQLAGPGFTEPVVGRGGAQADFDGDGRMDIAVVVHGGQPLLLRNTSPLTGHWLAIRLRQSDLNTRALGSRVFVRTGDLVQSAQLGAEGSYLSQAYGDLHFGLGTATRIDELIIHWPDGSVEKHADLQVDRLIRFDHQPDY
jgi:hypothetical protein